MRGEELQQLVFEEREVERAAVDRGLIRLGVEDQRSVLEEFGTRAAPCAPEQVLESGLEFTRLERQHAEVVEQVVAQFEVVEVLRADEHQQWFERLVAF